MTDVTPTLWREFYAWRRKDRHSMVSHLSTAHCTKDCTLIRQVLNHAVDDGHLPQLPRIIRPGTIGKNPRPWLTAEEWVRLVAVAHQRIAEAQANGQTKVVEQRQTCWSSCK